MPADRLRLTVTSGHRRVDLVLPAAVPVAELVPELARSVGLSDPRGCRLATLTGRVLAPDGGLAGQGVEDGGLLTVTADAEPPRVHDDVAEAMADVVAHDLAPWGPGAARRTSVAAAALLLGLGAAALALQRGAPLAGPAALVAAVVLGAAAAALSRVDARRDLAVPLAWAASAYAAAGGPLLAADPATALAAAGGGALVAGLLALVGLGAGRALMVPPVVVGAVALATGLLVRAAGLDVRVVLTTALVLVVLAGSVLPWLALGLAGAGPSSEGTGTHVEVDLDRVRADARLAHQILVAIEGAVGLLLVLVAPFAVRLGLAGTLLAVVACATVLLRTRHHRAGTEVLTGLVGGLLGLVAVAVSVLAWWPAWRPGAAGALVLAGAVAAALGPRPAPPSVRRARLGDLAETTGLLALAPLLVVASGVVTRLGG